MTFPILQELPHSDSVAAIAASLSVIANVGQSLYARHKGRKRDPLLREIRDDVREIKRDQQDMREHFDEKHDLLRARVQLIERASGLDQHLDDRA